MNWVRRALVSASESQWLRDHATRLGFIRRAATRFLPGESVDAAIVAARRLAQDGITTLLTHLGENVRDRAETDAVTKQYLRLIDRIRAESLPSEVSVKLTQLGLDLDREFCFTNLAKLIDRSHSADAPDDKTLWIDMEQSPYVAATLELYARARQTHRNVGVCVQAYLHRTEKDVESLISMGASVRLVKGAYSEPPEIAFPKKADADENYFHLARMLLSPEARRAGVRAVIATHDSTLIARIVEWAAQEGIEKRELEFAMLYGIQRGEQLRLAREGFHSGVLISYGSFWFPWFMRRLAERPANILFLIRNLFSD
jgi:proline dehydrogenase